MWRSEFIVLCNLSSIMWITLGFVPTNLDFLPRSRPKGKGWMGVVDIPSETVFYRSASDTSLEGN